MKKVFVSVVIPACNEEKTIADVIKRVQHTLRKNFEVIVVNDKSTDNTRNMALKMGALVVDNEQKYGQTLSLMRGIRRAKGTVIVTMDADLEHRPEDIPYLLRVFEKYDADVVIGRRKKLPRITETLLSLLTRKITGVKDTISGFRVIKKKILKTTDFGEKETWGAIFLVKCAKAGLRIVEVPITSSSRRKHSRTGNTIKSNLKVLRCMVYAFAELL